MLNETQRFYVYIIFRPNGKACYVGKGCGGRVDRHFSRARAGTHSNSHLANIINAAGGKLRVNNLPVFEFDKEV